MCEVCVECEGVWGVCRGVGCVECIGVECVWGFRVCGVYGVWSV